MVKNIVVLILCFIGGLVIGYTYRGQATDREVAQYRENEANLLAKLAEQDKQREVVYRDRVRIVEKSSAACLATRADDDILGVLPGGDKAKRSPN